MSYEINGGLHRNWDQVCWAAAYEWLGAGTDSLNVHDGDTVESLLDEAVDSGWLDDLCATETGTGRRIPIDEDDFASGLESVLEDLR